MSNYYLKKCMSPLHGFFWRHFVVTDFPSYCLNDILKPSPSVGQRYQTMVNCSVHWFCYTAQQLHELRMPQRDIVELIVHGCKFSWIFGHIFCIVSATLCGYLNCCVGYFWDFGRYGSGLYFLRFGPTMLSFRAHARLAIWRQSYARQIAVTDITRLPFFKTLAGENS